FDITIDATTVALGQVRSANIEMRNGSRVLHMPITTVRNQPIVPISKTCSPASFPVGGTSNCSISVANSTSFDPANVTVTDDVPDTLSVVPGSVVGATQSGNHLSFSRT